MCDCRAVAGREVTFNWFMMILKNYQSQTVGRSPVQDLQLLSGRHRIRARFNRSQVDTSTFFLSYSHALHLSHQEISILMIGYALGWVFFDDVTLPSFVFDYQQTFESLNLNSNYASLNFVEICLNKHLRNSRMLNHISRKRDWAFDWGNESDGLFFVQWARASYISPYSGSRTHPSISSPSDSRCFGTKLRKPHLQYQSSYRIQCPRTISPVLEDLGLPRVVLETQARSNNGYSVAFSFKE